MALRTSKLGRGSTRRCCGNLRKLLDGSTSLEATLTETIQEIAEAEKDEAFSVAFSIAVTSSRGNTFNVVKDSESIHVSTQLDQGSASEYDGLPYVWVTLSARRRSAYLEAVPKLSHVFPLLLGELAYLGGQRGSLWAARVLASFAYPKKKLPIVLQDLVQEALILEMRKESRSHFVNELVADVASVKSLAVTIRGVERLRGRRARLDVDFVPTYAEQARPEKAIKNVSTRSLVVVLGPSEFSMERNSIVPR